MTIQGIEVLNFWVPGPPKTKGSMRVVNASRAVLADSPASQRWRKLVAYEAERAIAAAPPTLRRGWPLAGAVAVDLTFGLSGDPIAPRAGDLDKLYRNVLDALTDAGVYEDDVQVVRLSGWKHYAAEPGVRVRVVI